MLSLIDFSKAGRVGVSLTLHLFLIGNRKCAGHCTTIARRPGKIGDLGRC